MSDTIARRSRSRVFVKLWIIPTFYVVGIGIATIPIFTTRYPSLNDYLSHLARGYVLLHYNEDPAFARFFVPNWQPLPNLAFDVWVLVFGQVHTLGIVAEVRYPNQIDGN